MLNIAGPEYDLGSVGFVVLEECEHRRRSFDDAELAPRLLDTARTKLAKIKAAYDEFGGSAAYWQALETEVLQTPMCLYSAAARGMNAQERSPCGIWRGGDPLVRIVFALGGLLLASLLIFLLFVRIFEFFFAIAFFLTGLL